MRTLLTFLLVILTITYTHAAANGINGELIVKVGTTGNKAIPTSQTTNVTISATSRVTDDASAVAFSLNSSNVLSGTAKLLELGNSGTAVFSHYAPGLFEIDSANADVFGFDGTNYFDLALNNGRVTFDLNNTLTFEPTIGASSTPYVFGTSLAHTSGNLAVFKNNGTERFVVDSKGTGTFGDFSSDYYARATIDTSTLSLFKVNANTSSVLLTTFPGGNTDASIQGTVGGALKFFLEPNVDDSGGAIAYKFDTVNTLTHTDNLLAAFAHGGTNKVTITPPGAIGLAAITNQVVFGATNTAPSSAVAPTKWISVQVQGESTVYRLPLYQ